MVAELTVFMDVELESFAHVWKVRVPFGQEPDKQIRKQIEEDYSFVSNKTKMTETIRRVSVKSGFYFHHFNSFS